MLSHIHISHFTIIDELDLNLKAGMTVLTGETGAGKSILIDALGLVLGGRAGSSLVRHGAERCHISASFNLAPDSLAQYWLEQQALDNGNECMIRRTLATDGKSKAYINGCPVTLQQLKELGERLISIHGQHEHQTLQQKDKQRQLLDAFANLQPLVEQVKQLYQAWHVKQKQLDALLTQAKQREQQQTYLQFQIEEWENLSLQPEEFVTLQQEHRLLVNADKLLAMSQQSLMSLSEAEGETIIHLLQQVCSSLTTLSNSDSRLNSVVELVSSALIQTEEAASELRHYIKQLDSDPGRLEWLEERLGAIYELARKHKVRPEDLGSHFQELIAQLQVLTQIDEQISHLQQEINKIATDYATLAGQLTAKRQTAAKQLSQLITEQMQLLAMPGGQFDIALQARTEYHSTGLESVEFLVSTNPGYPLQPLSKVASGGELSRISLAIQVITAQYNPIPTLIFDEVDVGIGGSTAAVVGRLLRLIGTQNQVLCVTHLPQVAAQGHHHLRVEKQLSQQTTITRIQALTEDERMKEVARMLGGVVITEQTLAHAKEMLMQV